MSKITKYNVPKAGTATTNRSASSTSVTIGNGQSSSVNESYVQGELAKYLRKDIIDYAYKLITFVEGLSVGDGTYGIDAEGVATLRSLILGDGSVSGVATTDTPVTDNDTIATPAYVSNYAVANSSLCAL